MHRPDGGGVWQLRQLHTAVAVAARAFAIFIPCIVCIARAFGVLW